MLTQAVETYLAVRRAAGFALRNTSYHLKKLRCVLGGEEAALHFYGNRHRLGGTGTIACRSVPVGWAPSSDSPDISVLRTTAMRCRQRFSVG